MTDELLEWPPDIFALTNVILSKSEAFRFALVPVGHWPPSRYGDWSMAVEEAGRQWSSWVDNRRGEIPELVLQEWRIFNERAGVPLEHVAAGHEQRLCEALLTLHAIADEACAGVGIALDSSDGEACVYRARPRAAGQDRVAVADQPPFHASSAQGRDAAHGQTGILALRLRARTWHLGSLAQGADQAPRDRYHL